MTEIWKPIKGAEDLYEISNLGKVRGLDRVKVTRRWTDAEVARNARITAERVSHPEKSGRKIARDLGIPHGTVRVILLDRTVAGSRTVFGQWLGRPIIPHRLNNGYWAVTISYRDGRRSKSYVHRLLMEAFGPPRPLDIKGRAVVRHLDDNKDNNSLDNLAWGTQSDNQSDARRNGRMMLGTNHPLAKLDYDKAELIRAATSKGVSILLLARQYGVDIHTIYQVKIGKTWREEDRQHHVPGRISRAKMIKRDMILADQERLASAAIIRLAGVKRRT